MLCMKFIDTSDTRISDIFQQYRNPPRSPTPVQDGYVEEAEEEEEEAPVESIVDTDVMVSVAGDPNATLSSSLRFIQESEIEIPTFNGVWVEKADATGHEDVANGHWDSPDCSQSSTIAWMRGASMLCSHHDAGVCIEWCY
jgi:hypothetical protein